MVEVPPAFYDASSPDPALWPPKEFIKLPENHKPKKEELIMTWKKKRQCSVCDQYGHNKATCKKSKTQVEEEKKQQEIRKESLDKLRDKWRSEQTWALVALVNAIADKAGIGSYLDVDTYGLVRTQVLDVEVEGADAVHVMLGAISESRNI